MERGTAEETQGLRQKKLTTAHVARSECLNRGPMSTSSRT